MQTARIASFASVLLATLASTIVCQAAQGNLESELEEVLAAEGLTGIAWALANEKGEVSLSAAGTRDSTTETRFTIDTRFHIGSVMKSLLATGILRLATVGSIELDAPADHYLPNLSFDNPWQDRTRVTVRHLLDHTAGLDDAHMWQMFSERPKPNTPLVAAFPEPSDLLRIRSRPGSRFSYSNMGYTLLGLIIETVTKENYETYLDKQLLAPLAMRDSTFAFTTQVGEYADRELAWGHVDDGTRYAASPVFLRPAAQFTTTAADLIRFAQFIMSDGELDGEVFIDSDLMQSRGRPSGTEAADSGLIAGYALGLGRRDRHGVVGYCHSGNIVGFVAMLCIFPDQGKAFGYSVNTDSESADYGRIDKLLIDALRVDEAPAPATAEPVADIAEWHGSYVLSPNRFQTFAYLDTVFGAVRISGDSEWLTMTSLQQAPRRLWPLGGRLFSANDRATASHVFLRGENDEYLVSDGFKTYEKVADSYLAAHWTSIALGVLGFSWLVAIGFVSLIRHRAAMIRRPEAPVFVAFLLLLLPVPFFLAQPFMALGDLTLASALLATATFLLPVAMVLTIVRVWRMPDRSRLALVHGLAAVFALQWFAALAIAGLLPLRLWA